MTTCVIQARMNSFRLPGKTLMVLAGKTTLQRVVERVRMAELIENVVVATSTETRDDAIVATCERMKVDWIRGDEGDVLSRYKKAALHFGADPIVRVTGDCPLIDPGVLNALVRAYRDNTGSFITNNLERTFPLGLDAEVFSFAMLEEATLQKGDDYDSEHVTQWMRRQSGAVNLTCPENLASVRLTLDTEDDARAFRLIFGAFRHKRFVSTADVLWLLDRRPDISALVRGH